MTDPLVPSEVDLRDFAYMPLDVVRLRDSDIAALATGDGFRAAVLLWCAAWHQQPAASLPDDDRILARLAGYGRDLTGWGQVREDALRGFVKCADGRLYHPVIAEKAVEAWHRKQAQRARTAAATNARKAPRPGNADVPTNAEADGSRDVLPPTDRDGQRDDDRDVARNVHQGKGEESNREEKNPPKPPRRGQGEDHPRFAEFWEAMPKRGAATNSRKDASTAFTRAVNRGADPEAIVRGAGHYAAAMQAAGKDGTEYVKQGASWLNAQLWEQYQAPGPPPAGKPTASAAPPAQGPAMEARAKMLRDRSPIARSMASKWPWQEVKEMIDRGLCTEADARACGVTIPAPRPVAIAAA